MPWKPIAVSDAAATGSWIWRLPIVASTRRPRRSAVASGRGGLDAIGAVGRSPTPGAERRQDQRDDAEHGDARRRGRARRARALGAAPALAQTRGLPGARRSHRRTVAHGNAGFIPRLAARRRGIRSAAMARRRPTIQIPRWIQLVGLPVLLLLAFLLARTLGHVLFLFLTAAVIAFTLNPLVRELTRRLPRGLSVAIVFVALRDRRSSGSSSRSEPSSSSETRSAAERIDAYLTEENAASGQTGVEVDVDRLQAWLDDHGLEGIQDRAALNDLTESIGAGDISGYAQDAISFAQGAALSVILLLFSILLVVVIAIYMLLDMPRLERAIDRRFPPHGGPPLTQRIESALVGLRPRPGDPLDGDRNERRRRDVDPRNDRPRRGRRAVCAPLRALDGVRRGDPVHRPVALRGPAGRSTRSSSIRSASLWVRLLFVFIYQVEGHVVVPNVMANALRLHPLLVIFGLLAGGELYGIPGVLVALPTMAAGRAIWEFFRERIDLEPWDETAIRPSTGGRPRPPGESTGPRRTRRAQARLRFAE